MNRSYSMLIVGLLGCSAAALFTLCAKQCAAAEIKPQEEIAVWPGAAPGSENWDWEERVEVAPNGMLIGRDVVKPTLQYYPADRRKAVGTAMVVAPGGGFGALMLSYEGVDVAKKLNSFGIDAFILKYRLLYTGPGAKDIVEESRCESQPDKLELIGKFKAQKGQDLVDMAVADGQQAIRVVRSLASKYGYAADRVGMMGYSAGGVVTSESVYGPADGRPDFAAVIYGVGFPHKIPNPAPPLFLAVACDDYIAFSQTMELFTAYHNDGGKVELYAYQKGGHGFPHTGGGADYYLDRLGEWLKMNGFLDKLN